MNVDALGLTRLLQLASPTLPVGAYSYSGGLESAIDEGIVADAPTAETWIRDVLEFSLGSFEAPLLFRMIEAIDANDYALLARWNTLFRSGRETAELRTETLQMGHALVTLLNDLPYCDADDIANLNSIGALTYPAVFAFAAHHMKVGRDGALVGYLWSWLENQVMAALKGVPLGQTAGQRMLASVGGDLPAIVQRSTELADDEMTNFAPGLAIASSRHETQYSRLWRS
jgi:urease accessory protein